MKEYMSLIEISIIFVLSLGGAYVLFKFLKSTALIKKTGQQAGGALAGFLLVYGALFYSFQKLNDANAASDQKIWTIVGTVVKDGASKHDGITVKHVPPAPSVPTDISGAFRLENVRSTGTVAYPEIRIESDGFYPRTLTLSEKNATIEADQHTIRLNDDIKIIKVIE